MCGTAAGEVSTSMHKFNLVLEKLLFVLRMQSTPGVLPPHPSRDPYFSRVPMRLHTSTAAARPA